MPKLWLVAKQEYLKRVKKKTFLVGTLLIPFMIGVSSGSPFSLLNAIKTPSHLGMSITVVFWRLQNYPNSLKMKR